MKQTIQDEALKLASEIHAKHRGSYWTQQQLVQELIAELARLDREFQESEEDR